MRAGLPDGAHFIDAGVVRVLLSAGARHEATGERDVLAIIHIIVQPVAWIGHGTGSRAVQVIHEENTRAATVVCAVKDPEWGVRLRERWWHEWPHGLLPSYYKLWPEE